MELFILGYAKDIGGHSSAFLVTAIYAAACELLSPPWINSLGKASDVATLRQYLVSEANKQEALAGYRDISTRQGTWSRTLDVASRTLSTTGM